MLCIFLSSPLDLLLRLAHVHGMAIISICSKCRVHKTLPAVACEDPACPYRSPRIVEADGIVGVLLAEIEEQRENLARLAEEKRQVEIRLVYLSGAVKAYGAEHFLPAEGDGHQADEIGLIENAIRRLAIVPGEADGTA